MKPLAHWSELKSLHGKIVREIDPRLLEFSFLWMMMRTYLLAPVFPSFRSQNMRAERVTKATDSPSFVFANNPTESSLVL
jgi:hypothetical protein